MSSGRTLLAAGGRFALIPVYSLVDLSLTGFWNDAYDPRAVTYNGKTYFAYVNDSGDIFVSQLDHATQAVVTHTVGTGFASTSGDVHNSAAILVRNSDHRIIIVECSEDADHFFVNVTTNPEDVSSWGTAAAILSGGGYTYPSLAQLGTDIYLFASDLVSGTRYCTWAKSTDGGATWGAKQSLIAPNASDRTYRRVAHNGSRIDIFTTDSDRTTTNPSSIYHLYTDDGSTWKQSNGTTIAASRPFVASSGTLVRDASAGRCRPTGWGYDVDGNPAVAINERDLSGNTPPEYAYAGRFDGATWSTHLITDSGAQLVVGTAMVKNDPTTVFLSKLVGSALELHRYHSNPDGTSWAGTQLTSTSGSDYDAPETPVNPSGCAAIVPYGLYGGPPFSYALNALLT